MSAIIISKTINVFGIVAFDSPEGMLRKYNCYFGAWIVCKRLHGLVVLKRHFALPIVVDKFVLPCLYPLHLDLQLLLSLVLLSVVVGSISLFRTE